MNGFELTEQKINQLVELALRARERAYVPYSHFRVGACLMSKNGTLYCGCNIENAGYTPTNCAERTAIFKAVYEGERQFFRNCRCFGQRKFYGPVRGMQAGACGVL